VTSGKTWTTTDLVRVLRLLRSGNNQHLIAQRIGLHRETVGHMIDAAALLYLEVLEGETKMAEWDNLTDPH
jgi:transcriptional regulator